MWPELRVVSDLGLPCGLGADHRDFTLRPAQLAFLSLCGLRIRDGAVGG